MATDGRLPTFLVIGAMKSGTSALREYLRTHPEVWLPPDDELHFFLDAGEWARGVGWYRAQFADAPDAAVALGEKSPTYTMMPEHPHVAERIGRLLPGVRLVYLVRDPVERIVSHWVHMTERAAETRPLAAAVRTDPRYVDTSRYAMQLDEYLEHVERDQILVLTSEQLDTDPSGSLRAVAHHIGVDPDRTPERGHQRVHRSADKIVPSSGLARLKRVPGYAAVATRVPPGLKQLGRRVATRPVAELDTHIDDGLRSELLERLGPDTDRLRAWLGDAVDAWNHR